MEQQVQKTIQNLKLEDHSALPGHIEMSDVTYEDAAALPKGVRARDVAASQLPGLLVTVIIPVYNSAATLKDAVDSVLAQDMHFESADRIGRGSVQEMEVLVIDDDSTDDPDSVMRQYESDPRVLYLHNKNRLGAATTRNRGALLARGKYIAYLDADDLWKPDKLKKQFERIFSTGDVLCCSARELILPDGSRTGKVIGVKETLTWRDMLMNNQINCSSVVLLTEVARRYPMIHEDSHEDYITWMNILNRYEEVCAVNEPLILYRVSSTGKSGGKLKSARMRYRAYRYLGFGPVKSAILFSGYAVNGVIKYVTA
jgi:teichuronic acid biosynthesis glycosyltransferase TuaG